MTDDFVKRLRSPEVFIDTGGMISPVAYQAADRIEQLETALREIIMCWNYEQCAELARAALGEKKDG